MLIVKCGQRGPRIMKDNYKELLLDENVHRVEVYTAADGTEKIMVEFCNDKEVYHHYNLSIPFIVPFRF